MSLTQTLEQIEQLKKEVDALRPLSAEAEQKLWKKLRLEWNYNSNHIEGNTLTYGETVLLLINGKTTGDHEVREYEEMKAHDFAIHEVKEWAKNKERALSEADIRQLNQTILKEPFWKEALTTDGQATRRLIKIGEYKEFPNSVRLATGEMFHYASPTDTPKMMKELMEWYRENSSLHPAVLAAELHYRFICIHPFDDGNGRVARLMVNFVLMQSGYPPIVVKSADKKGYLTALQKADAGDREAFQEYMANELLWSLEIELKAAKGESIEERDDLDKEIELLKRSLQDKDVVQIKISDNRFRKEWQIALEQMLVATYNELQKFSDLFESTAMKYSSGGQQHDVNHISEISQAINTPQDPRQYRIEFEFKIYKAAGTDYFDTQVWMEVNLHQYKYSIVYNDAKGKRVNKEYLYNQIMGKTDMESVAKDMAKSLLQNIKTRSGRD